MGVPLIVGALVQLLACGSFALVARILYKRRAVGDEANAVAAFIVWWAGMAIFMASRGIFSLLADSGWTSVPTFVAARHVEIIVLCMAAWGLTYYVSYMYTGWTSMRILVGAYYLLIGLAYEIATWAAGPNEVRVSEWDVSVLPAPVAHDVIYVLFGLPPIVATAAYVSLAGRAIDPIQRYRVILVSIAILGWIGSGLAAALAGDPFWSFIAITVLGIVTAAAVLFAYRPPRFVRLRWANEEMRQQEHDAEARAGRLRSRIVELI